MHIEMWKLIFLEEHGRFMVLISEALGKMIFLNFEVHYMYVVYQT